MQFTLEVPRPFDLHVALHGHGWVALAPHAYDATSRTLTTALDVDGPVDVTLGGDGDALTVTARAGARIGRARADRITAVLRRMLRLDDDLTAFHRLCGDLAHLRWAARLGAGRLLRSATVFEDLMKLLFTTNCSWAATEKMAERLVAGIGAVTPSGRRAFPVAAVCATQSESFWRDEVRVGYRASSCHALSEAFASGVLSCATFDDPSLPTDEVRRRLLAIRGFGPYAAGQALRLLGRYDDLALDSWCRARLAQLRGRRKPPADATIAREYDHFGAWRGLVLWTELTADWFAPGGDAKPV